MTKMEREDRFLGYNQEKIQGMNRTLVLNLLRKGGICSRTQLAKESGLKQATITNIVNDFIEWGIVKETGFLTGDKGRRSIGISMDQSTFGILAVRLARRGFSIGVFDMCGNPVKIIRRSAAQNQDPETVISSIFKEAVELMRDNSERHYLACGIALPGPYSLKSGRIEIMTGTKGWHEIAIRERFEEALDMPVFVEQDANAAAFAQYWKFEEEHPGEMLLYLAVGPGIGAGIIQKGQILRGRIGVAGEIGHMSINYKGPKCVCGNRGCLENYCSSRAFVDKVNRKKKALLSFEETAILLKEGDPDTEACFFEICDILAIAIANLMNCFNPSVIILGDEMSHIIPERMLSYIRGKVKDLVLPALYEDTLISTSLLPIDSFVHGAAVVAWNQIFTKPELYFNKYSEDEKKRLTR